MAHPRRSLLKLNDTSYYHVTVRCVRRAWLCGIDAHTGKDYSHRKGWFLDRAVQVSAAFCIDVCAYAILHDRYHLVLHVDRARCTQLSNAEIIQRWGSLFRPPAIFDPRESGRLAESKGDEAEQLLARWRNQLCDLSWFMRCLNQHLARRANREDGCTGIFWETRFKSRPLADQTHLLLAMAYVDLSPMRLPTSMPAATTGSTSLHARIEQSFQAPPAQGEPQQLGAATLLAPCGTACIPFAFRDYLELLDWTGRRLRDTESSTAEPKAPQLLQSLGLDVEAWLLAMRPISGALGQPTRLEGLQKQVLGRLHSTGEDGGAASL